MVTHALDAEPLGTDHRPQTGGTLADEEIVERIRRGESALFEVLMRRHNQRLYRAARAILGDEREAEDVMHDAYVRAYQHLDQFAGRAAFSTWLTRIAVHEALARARRRARTTDIEETMPTLASPARGPEQQTSDRELGRALEAAIDNLPEAFRGVFVLREVEGLSTAETATCLDIAPETVKTRLHRARARLRQRLEARLGTALRDTFVIGGTRCDRVVAAVLGQLGLR